MQVIYYEFFAGGGMARAGLGPDWQCAFANDIDPRKAASYVANWGAGEMLVEDIRNVGPADLPGRADLAWASFPCQDLSLAGSGAGLGGARSGTFWPFMALCREIVAEGRAPAVIALENVVGTLTSQGGKDFEAIMRALVDLGYRPGAMVVDAAHFVPQSRPRLFVVALRADLAPVGAGPEPMAPWHTAALRRAVAALPARLAEAHLWWHMPVPAARNLHLVDLIEDAPQSVAWHGKAETRALLSMMSDVNLAKVHTAQAARTRMVGGVYKRTRMAQGVKVQRAEVRFDDVAGCLRTPAGGSSRQLILVVEGDRIRSRLISARETARLMGLPDSYVLPARYNEAYHLTGDGVVVPVVRHIAHHVIAPLVAQTRDAKKDDAHVRDPMRPQPRNPEAD